MSANVQFVGIVNSFNRIDLLREALPSLCGALEKLSIPCAVVVFDAGSTDGSADYARSFKGGTIPIRVVGPNAKDNSFSAGINTACDTAINEFPALKYLFLFETDNWTRSEKPIAQAIELLERETHLGAAGFTVRKHSGAAAGYGSRFPTRFQFIIGPQLAHKFRLDSPGGEPWEKLGETEWRRCDVVYTSPLVVKRAAWDDSKGLDAAEFPFSDTDVDWAWRLRKLGWRMAVIRSDEVVHDNRDTLSKWSETRALHMHRGRLALISRHRPGIVPVRALLFMRHVIEVGGALVFGFATSNWAGTVRKRWKLLRSVPARYRS